MSSHQTSRKELRASLILPIVITLAVLFLGWLLFLVVPAGQFNNALIILLGGGLIAFLIYWTRNANWQLRLLALLFALPALAGITTGLIQGRSRFIVIGVAITFVLLFIQRIFQMPTSYLIASRNFQRGNYEQALKLINKSIAARPDFPESYQLRASIRMLYKQFAKAEQDAKHAIALQPEAHGNYNTLGQVYLAEAKYDQAFKMFNKAASLDESVAMNQYHKGLSAYRMKNYEQAAEALSMSTKKTLPLIEYDLLAHFYLYKTLLKLGQKTTAETAVSTMQKFAEGVPFVEEIVSHNPENPHIKQLGIDLEEIKTLLPESTEE